VIETSSRPHSPTRPPLARPSRPSSNRLFHTYPQHSPLTNSITTVLLSFPVSLHLRLLHSFFNATVCITLRGASRLGRRRKALQNRLAAEFLFCGNANSVSGTARAIAADGVSGILKPSELCRLLGNRVAAQQTEGESGASLRQRTQSPRIWFASRLPGFRKGGGSE
jgi:hypothetical protein